jgi:type III secretion apparatus needle protein
MTSFLQNGSGTFTPKGTDFGQIGVNDGTKNITGSDGVISAATDKINNSANEINNLLANYNPNNPASLLVAQQAMANYNLSITVASSFIKSIEDTTKAVAQHIS